MVLVTDFVLPRTEAAPRENVLIVKVGQDLLKSSITFQSRGGVTVVEAAMVGADDLVAGLEPGIEVLLARVF